jgi:hypothetical protein
VRATLVLIPALILPHLYTGIIYEVGRWFRSGSW